MLMEHGKKQEPLHEDKDRHYSGQQFPKLRGTPCHDVEAKVT
jgi:hypothetical protein